MKCEEFWEGGPDGLEHLRECPPCAARYQREQRVAAGLKALGVQWRRTEAPGRLERRLVQAYRREMGVAPRRGWVPAVAWGAAVAATVLLAFFLMRSRVPQQVHRQPAAGMELAAADTPYTIDVTPALSADGFIPLPNADQIDPEDEVDVVRMEVPREMLIAMGLPVGEEGASESVEADVALGGDGVARAVRFLD